MREVALRRSARIILSGLGGCARAGVRGWGRFRRPHRRYGARSIMAQKSHQSLFSCGGLKSCGEHR